MFDRYGARSLSVETKRNSNSSLFQSFFKKKSVKDHGDSFSRLLVRKKDLISIY